ncbi:MAG: hypothetical protein ACR5KV_08290 [Wolbachia sp.]
MEKYISNTSLPLQEGFMLSENEIPIQHSSRSICHVECDKGSPNIFTLVACKANCDNYYKYSAPSNS